MDKLHAMLAFCTGSMLIGVAGCAAQTEDPVDDDPIAEEATQNDDSSEATAANEENVGTSEDAFIAAGFGGIYGGGLGYGGYGLGYGGYGGYGLGGCGGCGIGATAVVTTTAIATPCASPCAW